MMTIIEAMSCHDYSTYLSIIYINPMLPLYLMWKIEFSLLVDKFEQGISMYNVIRKLNIFQRKNVLFVLESLGILPQILGDLWGMPLRLCLFLTIL